MPDVTVSVSVSGLPASLTVGQTVQAVARVTTDVPDNALDQKPVAWASSAPAVASVDANGLVKALVAGTATIRASVGAVNGSAVVTVNAPVIDISAAQEAAIVAVPKGGTFTLRGPSTAIDCVVSA